MRMMRRHVRFGSFVLDLIAERLQHGGRVVHLRPKTFAVLAYLAVRTDRLLTREQILAEVWRGVEVDPEVVKVCISELRRALGADCGIETVHGRGYRFTPARQPGSNMRDKLNAGEER